METYTPTEEVLQQVRMLAGLFFTAKEIAIMLGLDADSFVKEAKNTASKTYQAFYGGRLEAEALHRKKVKELAIQAGSSPAQLLLDKMITKSDTILYEQ